MEKVLQPRGLSAFLLSCLCSLSLPRGVVGWSVISNIVISWSKSLVSR